MSCLDKITSENVSSVYRVGMRGRELMGGVGKTMMQSGGTFGTFMAIGMGIRCWGTRRSTFFTSIQLYSYGTFWMSTTALCPEVWTRSLVLSIKVQVYIKQALGVDALHVLSCPVHVDWYMNGYSTCTLCLNLSNCVGCVDLHVNVESSSCSSKRWYLSEFLSLNMFCYLGYYRLYS